MFTGPLRIPPRCVNGCCDAALVQPRVGGRLYYQWANGDAQMGKFTALTPDKKVAYTLRGDDEGTAFEVTVTIAEKAGVSAVTRDRQQ